LGPRVTDSTLRVSILESHSRKSNTFSASVMRPSGSWGPALRDTMPGALQRTPPGSGSRFPQGSESTRPGNSGSFHCGCQHLRSENPSASRRSACGGQAAATTRHRRGMSSGSSWWQGREGDLASPIGPGRSHQPGGRRRLAFPTRRMDRIPATRQGCYRGGYHGGYAWRGLARRQKRSPAAGRGSRRSCSAWCLPARTPGV
jgi:hypothetical protein